MTNLRAEDRHNRLTAALDLLRNGYRTRIVQAETGLPAGAIRKLCRVVLGKAAHRGSCPRRAASRSPGAAVRTRHSSRASTTRSAASASTGT